MLYDRPVYMVLVKVGLVALLHFLFAFVRLAKCKCATKSVGYFSAKSVNISLMFKCFASCIFFPFSDTKFIQSNNLVFSVVLVSQYSESSNADVCIIVSMMYGTLSNKFKNILGTF